MKYNLEKIASQISIIAKSKSNKISYTSSVTFTDETDP